MWVLIFAIIVLALVKLAFVEGLKNQGELAVPQAQIAVPVRATASGNVAFVFVEKGAQLAAGDRILQIHSEVVPEPTTATIANGPFQVQRRAAEQQEIGQWHRCGRRHGTRAMGPARR